MAAAVVPLLLNTQVMQRCKACVCIFSDQLAALPSFLLLHTLKQTHLVQKDAAAMLAKRKKRIAEGDAAADEVEEEEKQNEEIAGWLTGAHVCSFSLG